VVEPRAGLDGRKISPPPGFFFNGFIEDVDSESVYKQLETITVMVNNQ
jgi:hypothetical protein